MACVIITKVVSILILSLNNLQLQYLLISNSINVSFYFIIAHAVYYQHYHLKQIDIVLSTTALINTVGNVSKTGIQNHSI